MNEFDRSFAEKLQIPLFDASWTVPTGVRGPPNVLTVNLRGELGTSDITDLEQQIARASSVHLKIDSLGGDGMQALRLWECLIGREVTAHIDGFCFSAAVLVLQAASHRTATPQSKLMVHASYVFVAGTAVDLRRAAALNESFDAVYRNLLVARTGQPVATVEKWMAADTYFSPAEAVAVNLIDEIVE